MFTRTINPFEGLFDEFFSEFNLNNNKIIQKCKNNLNFPRHNIEKNEKQVIIQLAVPGYTEQQISVNVQDKMLTIQGSAKLQNCSAETQIVAHQIKSSYFKKSYQLLDPNLSSQDISCQLKYGILKITIQKIKQDEKKQKIKKIPIINK